MKYKSTFILILLILQVFYSCTKEAKKKPLNLIFIYADDWGYGDLGIHGSSFCKTPNIDKMAAEGTDFHNFTVSNPVCSPSRTAIMTGQFPARNSVHGHFATVESHMNRSMPDWLDPEVTLLPRLLKNAGYKTGHFGKWHLSNTPVGDAPDPTHYGYDEYGAFNLPYRLHQMSTDSTIYRAIDFIERNSESPFFVNVWLHEPHTPHYPKEEYMKQFAHLDAQKQVYAAVLAEADAKIGQLMNKLKELGIDENTFVIFSSDNGPEYTSERKWMNDSSTGPGYSSFYSVGETGGLKGRKRSLLSGGIRVPFIARCPSFVQAGYVDTTSQLSAVDILPTFLALASVDLPEGYKPDGESIVKALSGEQFERSKTIYWDWRYAAINRPHWPSAAIQEGNWKFLINKETQRRELYNLSTDWAEQENLAEQYPEKVKTLESKLDEWMKTLPTKAKSSCFSKERQELLKKQ
jgi:N-acetylgalactosamine-6-sulfatase